MDINADLHTDLREMFQATLMVIAGKDQYQIHTHTHTRTHWNQIIPTMKKSQFQNEHSKRGRREQTTQTTKQKARK